LLGSRRRTHKIMLDMANLLVKIQSDLKYKIPQIHKYPNYTNTISKKGAL